MAVVGSETLAINRVPGADYMVLRSGEKKIAYSGRFSFYRPELRTASEVNIPSLLYLFHQENSKFSRETRDRNGSGFRETEISCFLLDLRQTTLL